jgi:cyanophycinase
MAINGNANQLDFTIELAGGGAMNGTLALVGSGEYLPPIEPLDRWLMDQLKEPARVVCLPTAAGTEGNERIRYSMRLGEEHFIRLGITVEALRVVDRDSAMDEEHARKIREANFVYLSGGKPDYLYRTLADTPVWSAILQVLASGGVVAGCSAGAMIFGEKIIGLRNMRLLQPGFGLLPGALVMPHFEELPGGFATAARAALPASLLLVGVEDNTALVAQNGTFCVRGSGSVQLIRPRERRALTADTPALTSL